MKTTTIPSQIMGIRALSDESVSITLHTKEVSAEEKVKIFSLQHKTGWFMFSESEVQESDIPTAAPTDAGKTPSQRLRSVLFILWKQEGSEGKFEDFYTKKMELLINWIKEKLV